MRILSFCFLLVGYQLALSQHIFQLNGRYMGSNIYISNPLDEDGFCVDSVFVNDQKFLGEIAASAFELIIDTNQVKYGDSLQVDIHHRWNCRPKILSTTSHTSRFDVNKMEINENRIIELNVQSKGVIICYLQQYRWNKWVKISEEFYCKSELDTLIHIDQSIHSGTNKYRLAVQLLPSQRMKYSNAVVFDYGFKAGSYEYDKYEHIVYFERSTQYELFDAYGNLVKRGEGKSMSTEGLEKGAYYLNFDNQNVKLVINNKTQK